MKSFFAIFLLAAALCAVQAYGPLDPLVQGTKQSKNNVNSIINDLKRFSNNLKLDTENTLSNKKSENQQQLNNIVNPALNDIRANVDAAKAQGKNAEHCYTEAEITLSRLSNRGFSDLKKCEKNGKEELRSLLNNLDAAQITGNNYIIELDTIILNCFSSDILEVQRCAAIKLGKTNQSIKAFEITVSSLKSTAKSTAFQITLSADSCYRQAVSVVRSETTDVRISSNKCVGN